MTHKLTSCRGVQPQGAASPDLYLTLLTAIDREPIYYLHNASAHRVRHCVLEVYIYITVNYLAATTKCLFSVTLINEQEPWVMPCPVLALRLTFRLLFGVSFLRYDEYIP